jgi:acyl-CoA thioesterase-1
MKGLKLDRQRFIVASACLLGSLAATVGQALAAPPPGSAAKSGGPVPTILVVGDSLSAEYGLRRGTGWVALLDKRLQERKIPARIVNASISGDTTSGGAARLAALLRQHRPSHVILELGANDALRGLPLKDTEANLQRMATSAQAAGARVLIAGMEVPPNYGTAYIRAFSDIFGRVAKATGSQYVPFLLKGVADIPDPTGMFQADRIHPLEKAHPIILDNIWPVLEKMLR